MDLTENMSLVEEFKEFCSIFKRLNSAITTSLDVLQAIYGKDTFVMKVKGSQCNFVVSCVWILTIVLHVTELPFFKTSLIRGRNSLSSFLHVIHLFIFPLHFVFITVLYSLFLFCSESFCTSVSLCKNIFIPCSF